MMTKAELLTTYAEYGSRRNPVIDVAVTFGGVYVALKDGSTIYLDRGDE